jgi:hypothetical protein
MKVKTDRLTIDTISDVKTILMKNGIEDSVATDIILDIMNNNRSKALLSQYELLKNKKINEKHFYKVVLKDILN